MIVRKDGILENQPVTQSTSPWVNNITQLGGNSIATNSGVTTAGTQRVVLASDQASGFATQSTLSAINTKLSNFAGTPHVLAGTAGTETVTGNVSFIGAICVTQAGTVAITGHETITVPYNSTNNIGSGIDVPFAYGMLVNPTITFTNTSAYVVVYYD